MLSASHRLTSRLSQKYSLGNPRAPRRLVCMAQKAPVYEIAVKGSPETNSLGDCPFCHRALLTLEEKHVPYSRTYIDFNNKPQWLLDVNPNGTVPVMKDLASGEWTVDSGNIVDLLENKFPEPKLGTVESAPQVGNDVFPAFTAFLKAPEAEASEKEKALVAALTLLNEYLSKNGPYIGGADVCATDLALAPKLYNLKVALKHYKNWEIPTELTAVYRYLNLMFARDSWKNTLYSEDAVIAGWKRHLGH